MQMCVYCDLESPSDDHLSSHRMSECCEKPLAAREFHRKDHLRQHLRQVHKADNFTKAMGEWKSQVVNIRSRCGFCKETFQLWSERNDHLAEHFRNGASMKNWKGARGFEPAVATLVRHSIPPYLISTESTAMIPFSAESGNLQQPITPKPHFPNAGATPTSFEYLVSELGKYTVAQKAQGLIPTDQMLQEKARLIVYGDDDPWNQTAADNSQWLELFKQGHGIVDPAPSPSRIGQPDALSLVDQASQFPETLDLPWYWQSPECLAIYRQNKASFYPHHSIHLADKVNASEVLLQSDVVDLPTPDLSDFNVLQKEQGVTFGDDWGYYMEDLAQNTLDFPDHLDGSCNMPSQNLIGDTERQTISDWEGNDIFPAGFDLDMQQLFS